MTDSQLNAILARAQYSAAVKLPGHLFTALCRQAIAQGMEDPRRVLMPMQSIEELLQDPHQADIAALSTETLIQLCRQAMERPGP